MSESSLASPSAPPRPGYPYLTAIARVVLVVVGVSPWLLPIAKRALSLGVAGVVIDRLFWPVCHRLPERTLTIAGELMPICSRCAGIFAGMALGALIARPRLRMSTWRLVLVGAAAVMVLDVITQDVGLHPVFHPGRVVTGVALGYAMVGAFVTAMMMRRP